MPTHMFSTTAMGQLDRSRSPYPSSSSSSFSLLFLAQTRTRFATSYTIPKTAPPRCVACPIRLSLPSSLTSCSKYSTATHAIGIGMKDMPMPYPMLAQGARTAAAVNNAMTVLLAPRLGLPLPCKSWALAAKAPEPIVISSTSSTVVPGIEVDMRPNHSALIMLATMCQLSQCAKVEVSHV